MSEMDAPPKMEQFWNDAQDHNLVVGQNHGHGGSIVSSSGSTGSGHNQYERNLNFATGAIEDNEYGFPKKKTVRDPLSHRIIEKRRRDRMNNCLADLARLLPPSSLRKGRGRIEKTEIVELAIKHLRHLQCHPCTSGDKCEFNYIVKGSRRESNPDHDVSSFASIEASTPTSRPLPSTFPPTPEEHFRLGYHECMSETMHFFIEEEGMYPGDSLCVRIIKHLRAHSENLIREQFRKDDGKLGFLEVKKEETVRKMGGDGSSSSSGYQGNGSSGSDGNGGQDTESPELFSIPGAPQTTPTTPEQTAGINIDYEGENSCCSTQLSLDISEMTYSADGQNVKGSNKPPIPIIIGNGNSTTTSSSVTSPAGSVVLASNSTCYGNGPSSSGDEDQGQCQNQEGGDEGTPSSSKSQYKFKNNIKQRFVTDPENICSKPHPHLVTKASLKQNTDPQNDTDPTKCDNERNSIDEDCSTRLPKCSDRSSASSPTSRTISIRNMNVICDSKVKTGESPCPTHSPDCLESEMDLKLLPGSLEDANSDENNREKCIFRSNPITSTKPPPILGESLGESSSSSLLCVKNTDRVPAFALHDKGLYYIPLTIEKSMLSPYLAKIEQQNNRALSPPPLHPVTISVCFLLSPKVGEKGRTFFKPDIDPTSSPLMPLPLINVNHHSPIEMPIGPIPLITTRPIPLQVSPEALGLNLKTPKSSPVKELGSKFFMNRYSSKSRQYSPGPKSYPIMTNLGGHNHHHSSGTLQSSSHNLSQSHQYYPGYYSTDSSSTSSSGLGLVPPSHIIGGEYSSSSSSSNSNSSSGNRGLHGNVYGVSGKSSSRKRTMSNLSAVSGGSGSGSGSGSSSLGYHSFEKYSPPSSQDSFPTGSSNNFSSQNHSYNSNSGPESGSNFYGHRCGYHPSISGSGTRQYSGSRLGIGVPQILPDMHFGYGMNLNLNGTPHLLPFSSRDDKHEMERQRRSCSPSKNKRVKMGGRIHSVESAAVDNILKQKSLSIGLPITPLPSI